MEKNKIQKKSRSATLHELLRRDNRSVIQGTENSLPMGPSHRDVSIPKSDEASPYKSPYTVNSKII